MFHIWIKGESFLILVYCDFKFRACCSHQASNKNGTKWYRWEHFHKSKSSNRPQLLLGSRSALLCAGSLRRSPASCSAWPAPPWRGCTSIPLGTICTAWWWCCTHWQWPGWTRWSHGRSPCPCPDSGKTSWCKKERDDDDVQKGGGS